MKYLSFADMCLGIGHESAPGRACVTQFSALKLILMKAWRQKADG
jgi:hypothetical protein